MKAIALPCLLLLFCLVRRSHAAAEPPVDLGGRLELLVDDYLLDRLEGAQLLLHRPVRREVVFKTDAPWEGNASAFQSVFKDGDLYRMYYRGLHYRHSGPPAQALEDHPWFLCYAESDDGLHWRRPELGLHEFNGSTANNIILTPEAVASIGGDPAHTAAFRDDNPNCPAEAKYKIVIVGKDPRGLYVLKSADGTRFSVLTRKPAVTTGAFDSQNLMFWDPARGEYREYHRGFRDGVRDIMTAASKDLTHFPEPVWLDWSDAPAEHLYTNQVQPYYRAPHLLIGFPMRYTDRGWSDAVMELPELDERLARAKEHPRYATAVTDGLFMTSRDGYRFKRWPEAFIRPGPARRDTWVYGDNFIFWGIVETKPDLNAAPQEISLYATEGYWENTYTSVRRYTMRIDGFVSAAAPLSGGEVVTKPLLFDGGNLVLNYETSGAGSVQVEIQSPEGEPIPGYALADCPDIFGDSLEHVVRWRDGGDVRALAGKPVRLRFVLHDADLYAFRFIPYRPDPKRPEVADLHLAKLPPKTGTREPFVALEDDFQSAPAGASPTTEDLDPTVATAGSGWLISEGSPDRVQVLNDDPVGSGTPGTNHYLKIERRNENAHDGGRAWVNLAPEDATETENGIVEVSARVYVPSTIKRCVDIDAYDNPPNHYDRRAFHVRFYPDGRVCCYQGADKPVNGLAIQLDTWQTVFLRARMAEARFDLTVEGKTAADLPFANEAIHRIQTIGFCPNANECVMYVDEVRVKVMP